MIIRKGDLAQDGLPGSYGSPPSVDHAATTTNSDIRFAMEPVAYECDTGYALAADWDPIVFSIPRQADEQFNQRPSARP